MGATGSGGDSSLRFEVQFRPPVLGVWAEQNRPRFTSEGEAIELAERWHHGSECDVRIVMVATGAEVWFRKGKRQ